MSGEVLVIDGREITVKIDPKMGRVGAAHAADTDRPLIFLREPNERVLLHELLHVVLARALPWFRGQPDWTCLDGSMTDPNEQVTQWLEEFLWDAGYRRTPTDQGGRSCLKCGYGSDLCEDSGCEGQS